MNRDEKLPNKLVLFYKMRKRRNETCLVHVPKLYKHVFPGLGLPETPDKTKGAISKTRPGIPVKKIVNKPLKMSNFRFRGSSVESDISEGRLPHLDKDPRSKKHDYHKFVKVHPKGKRKGDVTEHSKRMRRDASDDTVSECSEGLRRGGKPRSVYAEVSDCSEGLRRGGAPKVVTSRGPKRTPKIDMVGTYEQQFPSGPPNISITQEFSKRLPDVAPMTSLKDLVVLVPSNPESEMNAAEGSECSEGLLPAGMLESQPGPSNVTISKDVSAALSQEVPRNKAVTTEAAESDDLSECSEGLIYPPVKTSVQAYEQQFPSGPPNVSITEGFSKLPKMILSSPQEFSVMVPSTSDASPSKPPISPEKLKNPEAKCSDLSVKPSGVYSRYEMSGQNIIPPNINITKEFCSKIPSLHSASISAPKMTVAVPSKHQGEWTEKSTIPGRARAEKRESSVLSSDSSGSGGRVWESPTKKAAGPAIFSQYPFATGIVGDVKLKIVPLATSTTSQTSSDSSGSGGKVYEKTTVPGRPHAVRRESSIISSESSGSGGKSWNSPTKKTEIPLQRPSVPGPAVFSQYPFATGIVGDTKLKIVPVTTSSTSPTSSSTGAIPKVKKLPAKKAETSKETPKKAKRTSKRIARVFRTGAPDFLEKLKRKVSQRLGYVAFNAKQDLEQIEMTYIGRPAAATAVATESSRGSSFSASTGREVVPLVPQQMRPEVQNQPRRRLSTAIRMVFERELLLCFMAFACLLFGSAAVSWPFLYSEIGGPHARRFLIWFGRIVGSLVIVVGLLITGDLIRIIRLLRAGRVTTSLIFRR